MEIIVCHAGDTAKRQCTTKSDTLELVKNGKSDYKIYVSDKAIPSEKHAAAELQKYIYEISESKLPITNMAQPIAKAINKFLVIFFIFKTLE